jgi:hypothetical protein
LQQQFWRIAIKLVECRIQTMSAAIHVILYVHYQLLSKICLNQRNTICLNRLDVICLFLYDMICLFSYGTKRL